MSMKAGSSQSTIPGSINGTIYGQTCYGDAIPNAPVGTMRIPPKLIWAANHRAAKSGKKFKSSKKKGTPQAYQENVDFLLGTIGITRLMSIWANRNIYALSLASETGVIASNEYVLTSVPSGMTPIGVYGVLLLQPNVNVSWQDYGGPGTPLGFQGNSMLPMYCFEDLVAPAFAQSNTNKFPFPNVFSMASFTPSHPQINFNPGSFSSLDGSTVTVFYGYIKTPPLTTLNLEFEALLATGSEYTGFESQQLDYPDVCGVGSPGLDLGTADSIPQLTFEARGKYAISQFGEANPADAILELLTCGDNTSAAFGNMAGLQEIFNRTTGLGASVLDDLTPLRTFAQANDIWVCPYWDTQQDIRQGLQNILDICNADSYWSGFVLKFIPRSEQSQYGNGVRYTPPCAAGPVYDLGPNEFLFADGESPLQIERKPQLSVPNCVPIEHIDNQNAYNTAVTTWQSQLAVYQQGLIKADTATYHEIPRHDIAQKVASMIVQRNVNLRNTYKFKLPVSFALLEPMDVVTLTEPDMQMFKVPARMTKVSENEDWELECEAEDFNWGVNAPSVALYAAANNSPVATNTPPGDVGDVVIFNVPTQIKQTAAQVELALGACSPNPAWGGAAVYVSNDNVTYKLAGTIQSGCTMGRMTDAFNALPDPDSSTYHVDLSESDGQLQSATSVQQNQFESLFVVQDISTGTYEIAAYGTVSLVGSGIWSLVGPIRRGVYQTGPHGFSVGARFALVDSTLLRVQVNPLWIGQTLYFKFCSFNSYGQEQQQLSDVSPITYSPTGIGVPTQFYTINGPSGPSGIGSLSNLGTTSSYQIQPFTSSLGGSYKGVPLTTQGFGFSTSVPLWYTVFDPSNLGDQGGNPPLNYFIDTTDTRANTPGYIYIGKLMTAVFPPGGGSQTGAGGSAGPR